MTAILFIVVLASISCVFSSSILTKLTEKDLHEVRSHLLRSVTKEEIRVGDLKQEFGGVNSYATSYSSAGFLAVGYFGDSQCKNSLMTGGIAVNQCYTHTDDGYAYKILLTKDSCGGGIVQFYKDKECTVSAGTAPLGENRFYGCSQMYPGTFVKVSCSTSPKPLVFSPSAMRHYFIDSGCTKTEMYTAVPANVCDGYDLAECKDGSETMYEHIYENDDGCQGARETQTHSRAECVLAPNPYSDDDNYYYGDDDHNDDGHDDGGDDVGDDGNVRAISSSAATTSTSATTSHSKKVLGLVRRLAQENKKHRDAATSTFASDTDPTATPTTTPVTTPPPTFTPTTTSVTTPPPTFTPTTTPVTTPPPTFTPTTTPVTTPPPTFTSTTTPATTPPPTFTPTTTPATTPPPTFAPTTTPVSTPPPTFTPTIGDDDVNYYDDDEENRHYSYEDDIYVYEHDDEAYAYYFDDDMYPIFNVPPSIVSTAFPTTTEEGNKQYHGQMYCAYPPKPKKAVFTAKQTITGVSFTAYTASKTAADKTIKQAVASLVENATETSISNLVVTDTTTTAAVVTVTSLRHMFTTTTAVHSNAQSILATDSVSASYAVTVTSARSVSDLSASLQNEVKKGTFTAALRSYAADNGVTALASASSTSVETVEGDGSSSDSSSDETLSTGAIIGIAVGGAAVLVLIIALIYYFSCMKRQSLGTVGVEG